MLTARVDVTLGEFRLDAEVSAAPGRVTAVLGPNGAGKTTLLRCIAGYHAVDDGVIELGGRVLDAPPATFVAPRERRLGVVHQDYLLFGHLSAVENVAFGLRATGQSRRAARAAAMGWLGRVGLADHAEDRPRTLSGGQAQRVALARALITQPDALLLDEPLAALDAGTRPQVRRDLARFLADFAGPTLVVTHDAVDAIELAHDVAVLEAGRLVQVGPVAEVLGEPRSRYVRDLVSGLSRP